MRIAVVGPKVYFENHYPEGWETNPDILCIDVDEEHYGWLNIVHNFRPDVTLFYRPELYPAEYVSRIPGFRIAFLSEPVPNFWGGQLVETDETRLRLLVYSRLAWDCFHWKVFYDPSKKDTVHKIGFPIDEFHELPINIRWFHPIASGRKRWDVTFVGKSTHHRNRRLDFLRSSPFRFLWIAHGVSGRELATVFKQSKVVLNIHADGEGAMEPRIYLAAACGAIVLTERLSAPPRLFQERIFELNEWSNDSISPYMRDASNLRFDQTSHRSLSVLRFIESRFKRSKTMISPLEVI
ncbi:glycosyltransferase family protein [Phyllobacterium bourgognense]|uniref:Spore protein YkvP/CgeB glycosyl transferase-like domain-containing protein n=1 Tax=Phyllobacterium bourgognense TaxID=314236 RepID=A0A368YVM0_9HYPH|nr:glycosyltransferase [Phyllobacterium bourgognense]RCW83588.1 hypothetical protein C7476_10582 [Phyllobacterium bourgognense]